LPTSYLNDGVYIFQYAQAVDQIDSTADYRGVACVVQVGNPEGTIVRSYRGTNTMDSSSMEGLMMTEINADDWEQDSTLEAPRDARSYELLESDVDIVNNRIQLCKASL
jgi:hypothetical protein